MVILAKIYPLPKISEEEYELARQQYGTAKKKKKKKPAEGEGDIIETESRDLGDDAEVPEIAEISEIKDEKYISKTIPTGISQSAKNNYQKTGKKYTIKKRKK